MNIDIRRWSLAIFSTLLPALTVAGIFAPPAGQQNSTAVAADDSELDAWATGYKDYSQGTNLDSEFQTPQKSLGVPGNSDGSSQGTVFDIVSLGRGGSITITFSRPIFDGPNYDFAVFENSFDDTFLEFAKVEVSTDGQTFVAFPAFSLVPSPVGAFGSVDATDVEQLAGKYRGGYGTPFDLQQLAGAAGVDLNDIRYLRLTDVVGDGTATNDLSTTALAHWLGIDEGDLPSALVTIVNGAPPVIYDVYPTVGSAGFDLDAVGVLNAAPIPVGLDVDTFNAGNEIDPESTADLPVTVFTTRLVDGDGIDFDAASIDASSLKLGYSEAPITSGPFRFDVDSDGDLDSSFYFQTQATGIACEDTELTLTGATDAAEPIAATDFVVTPECAGAACHP
jgi:hypothetical protein